MLSWAYRNRWRLVAATAVGSAGYVAWKTLRHIPLREIIELAKERERNEISETLRGGDGTSILHAHMQQLRADLNNLQDVASRQASLRVTGLPTSERVAAFQELTVASFARTISAVYFRCILELFVDVQVLLVKHQGASLGLRDDEQLRFLSALRAFGPPPAEEGQEGGIAATPSPLELLVSAVEAAVRQALMGKSPNEPCGGAWAAGIIEGIRGRVEGEPYCARRGLGSKGAPEVGGDARVRGRHGELTRMLLGLLAVGEGHGGAGLEARMKEVLESELWESAMAAVLDGGFQHLVRELGQSIPDGASLQMAKLVPVVSNSFGSVAGVGDWGGYQMMRVGDGGACRALFQVVGLGGG